MRHSSRHAAASVAALALLGSWAAGASAQDTDVVATAKSPVRWAKVLGSTTLVASDRPRNRPNRIQRLVDGRLVAAKGLTAPGILVDVEQPGRDRSGRVVVPFSRAERLTSDDRLVGIRWFTYDARKDEAKPLRGLPTGKDTPTHVAVWRSRTAYTLDRGKRAGVYVKDAHGTKRISKLQTSDFDDPLVLQGGNLVLAAGGGDGTLSLHRLLDGGEVCPAVIEPSTSDADHEFALSGAWISGGRVTWWQEQSGSGGNLLLSTDLTGDCADEPVAGSHAPTFERPLAVVGSTLYAVDGRKVTRRTLGEPSTAPPANDAIGAAQAVTGTLPFVVGARIERATRTPDEPPVTGFAGAGETAEATRTVWYSWKPTAAQPVTIFGVGEDFRGGTLTGGAFSVYEDAGTGTLTELPKEPGEVGGQVAFTADPAHRYLIGVGCDAPVACWPTFTLRFLKR